MSDRRARTRAAALQSGGMTGSVPVDEIDLAILTLLCEDARRSVADVARAVNLTPAPVKRRIDRLERHGVIAGYTALVEEARLGRAVEAFAELRVTGDAGIGDVVALLQRLTGVEELFTMAGDPDVLVRLRVADAEELRRTITTLRASDQIVSTRTLMVLGSWRRGGMRPRRAG